MSQTYGAISLNCRNEAPGKTSQTPLHTESKSLHYHNHKYCVSHCQSQTDEQTEKQKMLTMLTILLHLISGSDRNSLLISVWVSVGLKHKTESPWCRCDSKLFSSTKWILLIYIFYFNWLVTSSTSLHNHAAKAGQLLGIQTKTTRITWQFFVCLSCVNPFT